MDEAAIDQENREYGIDDPLPAGMGCLRDYVATGLISREKVELAAGQIGFEATFEPPNTHPGTTHSHTVRLSEAGYTALGEMGVP